MAGKSGMKPGPSSSPASESKGKKALGGFGAGGKSGMEKKTKGGG